MLTTRPASYRVTDCLGDTFLCADCKCALSRRGVLNHPTHGTPIHNELVTSVEPAPMVAVCEWCL